MSKLLLAPVILLAAASVPVTDLLTLAQSHAWLAFSAVLIGFVVRVLKDDAFVLPPSWAIAAKYRPLLAVGLGLVSGVLDAVVRGTPWREALVGGLLAALVAMLGHTGLVEVLRDGRELGQPPVEPDAPSKGPLYQPPASRESEEVTLPRGPRGVATVRSLVAALIAASLCALPLSAGCGARPLVVHVVDRADGVCPEVVIVLPEIGPVCTFIHTVDRLLELLAAAQAAGTGLTVEVDGHRVTIPPGKIEEVRAGVAGARASARRSAPVSTGSAR